MQYGGTIIKAFGKAAGKICNVDGESDIQRDVSAHWLLDAQPALFV
jgi:hypothetical protein